MGKVYALTFNAKKLISHVADTFKKLFAALGERNRHTLPATLSNTLIPVYTTTNQNLSQMHTFTNNTSRTKSSNGFNRWMMALLIMLITLSVSNQAIAQTYFTESFEGTWFLNGVSPNTATAAGPNAPSGWTQTRPVNNVVPNGGTTGGQDWSQESWSGTAYSGTLAPYTATALHSPPTAPPDGTKILWFNDYNCSSGNTRLIYSPAIDLSASTNPLVTFSYSYAQNSTSLTFMGSLDGGTTWNTLSTLAATTASVWVVKTITIPAAYKIATAKFGFQMVSTFGSYDTYIDNVVVRESVTPNAVPTAFTPSAITQTGMTIGWTDNSTNETAFRIYRSTDNATFTQVGSDIASTSSLTTGTTYSSIQTGLLPGVTYYYRVSAVADAESGYLTGSQATNPPGTITSIATGNWSSTSTWSTGVVPTATDIVTISTGNTVTLDATGTSYTAYSLTVAGSLLYNGTIARTLTVGTDVTINSGGSFATAASGSVTSHALLVGGSLVNNGILNFSTNGQTAGALITFNTATSANFTLGTGSTTNLRNTSGVTLNKGTSIASVLTFSPGGTLTVQGLNTTGFLTITNGLFKVNGANTFSNPLFNATGYSIPATGGLWMNNANAAVTGLGGSPTFSGLFRLSAGTYTVGTVAGNSVSGATTTSIIIEGGTLNLTSRLNITSSGAQFNMSGGTINACTLVSGNTSSATASFGFTSATSVFTMSGGVINIVQASTGSTQYDWYVNTTAPAITGGTLNIGTAATITKFSFTLLGSVPNLVIDNTTNAKTATCAAAVTAYGNTTINSGATFATGAFTYTERGSTFTNNGILNGTGGTLSMLTFTASFPQTIAGSGTVSANLNSISIQNLSGVTITHSNQIPTLRVNLFQGTVTGSGKITLGTGLAAAATTQIGSTGLTTSGGSYDANPTFNLGTGTYAVLYQYETTPRSTGFEIPATRLVSLATVGNPNNVTVAGGALGIGTLTLQAGNLITTTANLVTITGTTTTSTARTSYSSTVASSVGNTVTITSTTGLFVGMNVTVSAGTGAFAANTVVTSIPSTTTFVVSAAPTTALSGATVAGIGGWVSGPLAITVPASLASGSTYNFPIGKSVYKNFELVNPVTTAGGTFVAQAEVFDAGSGGTPGTLIGSISTNRYWAASTVSGAANLTNTSIRLNDVPAGADAVANSATLTGAYAIVGGVTTTVTATSIASSATTTVGGYYVMANKAAATLSSLAITPTGNACTNVLRTVTVTVTPGGAAVSGVVINYSINGAAQTAVTMTNLTNNGGFAADNWSGVIPAVTPSNGTVAWSVTATDANALTKTQAGTSYTDEPLNGVSATAAASLTTVCAGSPTSLSAAVITTAIPVIPAATAYCASTHSSGCSGDNIAAVVLNTLNKTTGTTCGTTSSAYSNFTGLTGTNTTTLTGGTAYPLSITFGTDGNQYFGAWIDYNHDGTYSASEFLGASANAGASGTTAVTFTVPLTAYNGLTHIRIVGGNDAAVSSGQACGASSSNYGETQDYDVTITGASSVASVPYTGTITSYSWSNGTSVVGTTNPLIVSPTATKTYTATIVSAGCSITSTGVTVTATTVPTTPNAFSAFQCGVGKPTAFVSSTGSSGNPVFKWYTAATGGTAFQTGESTTDTTISISATTTFYVSETNGTCESPRVALTATVNTPPVVSIASVGTPAGNICLGGSFNLSASSTNSGYSYTWTGTTPTHSGLTNGTTGALVSAVTPDSAATYTYSVSAIDATTGNPFSGCATNTSIIVIVNKNPVVDSVKGSPLAICAGSSATLNVYSSLVVSGPAVLPTGYLASSATSTADEELLNVSLGTAGSLLNNSSTCSSTGGAAANGLPASVLSMYSNYTALTPVNLTVGSSVPVSLGLGTCGGNYQRVATVYIDYNRNGTFDLPAEQAFTTGIIASTTLNPVTNTGTIVIPSSGTSAGYTLMRVVYTESSATTPTGTYTWGETEDYIVNLRTINPVDPSLTYTWTPGALTGSTLSVTPATTTSYTATVSNTATGCSSSPSSAVIITVNPIPGIPSVSASDQCGAIIPITSVTSTTDPLPASPEFRWYTVATGGTPVQDSTLPSYASVVSVTTTFYVSEISAAGCESGRFPITITVSDPDPLTVSASATIVCPGGSTDISSVYTPDFNSFATFTLTASPVSGSGVSSPVDLSSLANGVGTTPYTVTPTALGTYIYTITAFDPDKGCTSIGTVSVTKAASPVIDSAKGSPATVCAGATVTLKGYSAINGQTGPQTLPTGYGASNATSTADEEILNVSLGTAGSLLNNTSTCSTVAGGAANGLPASILEEYSNYSALTAATVSAGASVPVSLTLGTCGGNYGRIATVYIDYNRNGVFDLPAEQAYTTGSISSTTINPTTNTGTIAIPLTAAAGVTLMRVVYVESTTTSPTGTYTWGETEDYSLNILGVTLVNPTNTYTWNPGAITGSTATVTPLTTTTYALTVTNAAGCSSTTGTTGNPASVVINVNPVPDAPSGTGSTQCGSGVPSASVAGTGGTYIWYSSASGTTVLQTGGTTYSTSILATTTFYVSEKSAAGCESPRTPVTATVTTPPSLVIVPSGVTTFCFNGSVGLNASISSDPSYSTFAWSALPALGAGLSSTSGGIVTAAPTVAGTYTYTVTATGAGCSNTQTVSVTVNPLPVISTTTASPLTVCSGGTSTLTATSLGNTTFNIGEPVGTGLSSLSGYGMYFSSTSAATINTVDVYPSTAGTLTIQLLNSSSTVVDSRSFTIAAGDISTTVAKTLAVNFTIPAGSTGWQMYYSSISINRGAGTFSYPYANGAFTITGNTLDGNNVTGGTRFYFYNWNVTSVADNSGAYSWVWNPGALVGNVVTVNPTTPGANPYTVTATDGLGCSATSSVSVTVTGVGATVAALPATVCAGSSTTLTAAPTGGGPFTYSWSDGGATVYPATVSISVSPAVTTTYTVTVTDACGSPTTAQVTVNVTALPTIAIDQSNTTLCAPASITLTSTTNAATPAYQWLKAIVNIGGATSSSYLINSISTGLYQVKVTDGVTGCSATSAPITVSINPSPAAVTVTPVTSTICNGTNVPLTASGGLSSVASTFGSHILQNTSTSYPAPFSVYYGGQRMQMLVLASELTAKGLVNGSVIGSIGFPVASFGTNWPATTSSCQNFKVKMGFTTSTALTAFTASLPTYYGPTNFTPVVGLGDANLLNLTAGPTWDGVSNLIIETTFSNAITGQSADGVIQYYTTTPANTMIVSYADGITATAAEALTTISTGPNTNRPDFVLNATAPSPFTWSPATGLNTATGASVIATPSVTTTYTATATNAYGCTNVGTAATAVINLTPTTAVSVQPAPVSQTVFINDPSPATITLTATGDALTYQWYSNTSNSNVGGTSLAPAGQAASFAPPTSTLGTKYYYCVVTGTCGTATSGTPTSAVAVTVTNSNTWKGGGTTDWSTGTNWTLNVPPAATNDAVIPVGNTPYPVLTASSAIHNLIIDPTATVGLGGFTFTVNGAITGTGTLSGSATSSLVTNATTTVRFTAAANTLKNLSVTAGTTTLGNAVNITAGTAANTFGTVTVSGSGTLASNGNLTIKSNLFGTARVAAGATTGNYITGDVTVERYIPQNTSRAWRLLSVPTKGTKTIKQTWQENQAANANGLPGFGTLVTSNLAAATLTSAGFDTYSTAPSVQSYTSATQVWTYLTSTNSLPIETTKGYFLYIRGDRSIGVAPTFPAPSVSATTLRTTGTLYQGNATPAISIAAGKYEPVGNIFASAIDFTGLTKTGGISNTYYVWDSKLISGVSLGGYQTFNGSIGFTPATPGGSYPAGVPNTTIESGEAIMLGATGTAGTVAIPEASKTTGNQLNPFRPTTLPPQFKTSLFRVSGTASTFADNNIGVFGQQFSDAVDGDDAPKILHGGENLSIVRNATKLIIEARQPITSNDTLFFFMEGMQSSQAYKFEFSTLFDFAAPGLTAFVEDKTGVNPPTAIDLTQPVFTYNFTVDATAASIENDRFRIVFKQTASGPLPVSFISISANQANAGVEVKWTVGGERNIRSYVVESSTDGLNFNQAGTLEANRQLTYSYLDAALVAGGTRFYRIKSIGTAGEVKYSAVVKVTLGNVKPSITVSPNPVEGSVVNIQLKNQPKGSYNISLLSNVGQAIFVTVAEHAGGTSTQILNLPAAIARGTYQLEVIFPDKTRQVQTLFINSTK